MAKLNYARAATNSKPSDCIAPRSKLPTSSWNETKTNRQRQVEAWQRARQCLRQAGALDRETE